MRLQIEPALPRDLNRDHFRPHLTRYRRVVQVDLGCGDEPAIGQGHGEFLGGQVGHAALFAGRHSGAVELQLRVGAQQRDRLDLQYVKAVGLRLRDIEPRTKRRKVQSRLSSVRVS